MGGGVRAAALGLAALVCMGQAAPAPSAGRLEYAIAPVMERGALRAIQFDLRFRGESDGETALRLPSAWGGQEELWRAIRDLRVVSGAVLSDGGAPEARLLTHRPGAAIHLRYRIVQETPGAPAAGGGNTYRPVVQPGYFHLIGEAVLVTPKDYAAETPVSVRTSGMPAGWSFASDLEHRGLNLGLALSSVIVGGDFRIVESPDASVRIAIRGQWSFADQDFAARVGGIVAGQRRFWGDPPTPFLVTLLPLAAPGPGWTSIGGTGLQDAFGLFATDNGSEDVMTRLLAHESLHSWIPGRIGGMPESEAGERGGYWLSEGFTDFYTLRLLVRERQWTPAQFAAALNEMLEAYARSPVREAPNDRIRADFWSSQDVQRLPYQRGHLLAALWDWRLREAGARDLDDVVLAMRERSRGGDPLKAAELFPVVMEGFGLDVRADIASHVEAGAPILLSEVVFAPCGRIETRQVAEFHRGFDIEATRANNQVISGVDPALPAYAAGMRDGMVLIKRDGGEIGDSEQEIGYVVRDGETERTIRYMPRGRGSLTVQRLVLADPLEGERLEHCLRVLGGA